MFNPRPDPSNRLLFNGTKGEDEEEEKIEISERLKTEGRGESELESLSESLLKADDDDMTEGIPLISKCVVERSLIKKTNNMRISVIKSRPLNYQSSLESSSKIEEESASKKKPIFFQPRVPNIKGYLPCLYMEPTIEGKGVIVFFHGNGEDLNHSYEILHFLKGFTRVIIKFKKPIFLFFVKGFFYLFI